MTSNSTRKQTGLTLLEVVLSLGLMALLLAPTVGIMRTSLELWNGFESKHTQAMHRAATIRHLNGRLKRIDTILTLRQDQLVAKMWNGEVEDWSNDQDQVTIRLQADNSDEETISELKSISFVGYDADGNAIPMTNLSAKVRVVGITMNFRDSRAPSHTSRIRARRWK